jgi:hypothetical protein
MTAAHKAALVNTLAALPYPALVAIAVVATVTLVSA